MATDKNFVIKNGLTVGTTEIIDSSGNLVNTTGSISGTTITGSDRGTFEDLVLTGDADDDLTFTVSAGDWSILNSQQSNGLVIYDGTAGVQFLYNNTVKLEILDGGIDVENGTLSIAGTEFADNSRNVTAGTIDSGAITSTSSIRAASGGNVIDLGTDGNIEITRTSGGAYIDFKDSSSEDYDQRIQANTTGHSFSGTIDSGGITSTGDSTFSGVIGVGGTSTNSSYGVWLQNNKWLATQYSSSHDVVRINANTNGGLDIYNQTDSGFANVRAGSYNLGSTAIIDSSANLTNIGTISSGKISASFSSSHTTGTISHSNAALDLYNPLQANTDEKGTIITFSDNYYDGTNYIKTTRAAIKGGTDVIGNTADGYLAFYTDSGAANTANERLRIDKDGNFNFNSGNFTNVGTISSGAITSSGSVNIAGDLNIASVIAHTGDLDTYFQFNAADTARIVVGGSQKFVVNSSGVSISNGTLNMNSGNLTSVGTISSGAITSTGSSQVANLTVTGDLTVQGTTVTIDAATLNVEDKNITLNYSTGDSSGSADGAGITIQDAVNSTTDATILWDATNDKFEFSNNISLPFATASISFGGSTLGGPHGLIFNDDDGTSTFSMFYRTTPQTITFEIEGDVAKHTFERNGNYTADGDIYVGNLLVMAGGNTNAITFDGTGSDTNVRHFAYEASGHHYVTNRHTSGDLILMSNNGTGGGETTRITLKAGSGTQDIDITNANLDLNSNNINNVGTLIVEGDDNAQETLWGTAPTAIIGGFSSGNHDGSDELSDFRMAVISKDTNGGNTPVMKRNQVWVTGGISGEAYNSAARWDLGRWENNSTDARSRLDLYLADNSQTWDQVMTWRHDGTSLKVGIQTTTPNANLTVNGTSNLDGGVQVGDTVSSNSYGLLQVNQEANNDESGIGILSSGASRTMRLWVDETNSYINSGNGGAANLILNEAITVSSAGNLTGVGTISSGAITSSGDISAVKGTFTQSIGDFPLITSTPYDFTAKFESTDAGGYIVLEDSASTNNANYIGVNGNDFRIYTAGALGLTINSSQNATFAGTISSGRVTTSEDLRFSGTPRIRADNEINFLTIAGAAQTGKFLSVTAQTAYNGNSASSGMFNALNGYAVGTGNGTTVIDSSRNLTNIGTISSGAITSSGASTFSSNVNIDRELRLDARYDGGDGDNVLAFKDSSGNYSIRQNVNDGNGNYSISIGYSGVGSGQYAVTSDGVGKILFGGHGRDGAVSLNAAPTGTAGSNISFSIGLLVDGSDNTIRVGASANGTGMDTGATSGTKVFDASANAFATSYSVGASTVIDSSSNLTNIGTISSGQINTTTAADATPAIIATNTGGIGGIIQRWVGDSDSMEMQNSGTGDYKLRNTQQNNGINFYDGTGGVEIEYSGTAVQEWDSTGGTNLVSGSFKVGGTAVISSSRTITSASITATDSYGGGTGDFTDITTPQLKIVAEGTGYWRIPHLSGNASISGVYNYESGKDVYWGEAADTGDYIFRGRKIDAQAGLAVSVSGSDRLSVTGGDVDVVGATDLRITGASRRLNFTSGTGTIRTSTLNQLILQTNSTTALTLETNQNATFAANVTFSGGRLTNDTGTILDSDGASNYIKGGSGGSGLLYTEASTFYVNNPMYLNTGRGVVYFENNSNSNSSGAGVTLRTGTNPTGDASIFDVRSSGQACRLFVGQDITTSGYNPFYAGNANTSTGMGTVSNYTIELATNGNITAEGNVTAYGTLSDIRQKENIEQIDQPIERLQKIKGITFNYKKKSEDERLMGVIAQELLEDDILKLAVYEHEDFRAEEDDPLKHTYGVKYEHLTAILIEAVKEQQKQIEELKEEVSSLRSKN